MKVIDQNRGDIWSFDGTWYVQEDSEGNFISRLSQKNFPNPHDILDNKIKGAEKLVDRSLTENEIKTLRPKQFIYDIWEHKIANLHPAV